MKNNNDSRINIISVFIILFIMVVFMGRLLEKAIGPIIIDFIAPNVFYTFILFISGYLVYISIMQLVKREFEINVQHIYSLLLIGSLAGVIVAYQALKTTDFIINKDFDYILGKYIESGEKSRILSEEIDNVLIEIENLRNGSTSVQGIENIQYKIRDYVIQSKTKKLTLILSIDKWILDQKEYRNFLLYIDGLVQASPNLAIVIYAFFDKANDMERINKYFDQFKHIKYKYINSEKAYYNKEIDEIINKHYHTIFGYLGNYECLFLISPSGQIKNKFYTNFYIKSNSNEFTKYKNLIVSALKNSNSN